MALSVHVAIRLDNRGTRVECSASGIFCLVAGECIPYTCSKCKVKGAFGSILKIL